MLRSFLLWLARTSKLKPSELLFTVATLVAIMVVGGLYHKNQALEKDVRLTEDALKSAIEVAIALERRNTIDMAVVTTWIDARDTYRQQQRRIIDTTFLEYFNVAPDPIELPVLPVTPPPSEPAASHEQEIVYVSIPTPSVSDDRIRVLARGLQASYCAAQYDASSECPP